MKVQVFLISTARMHCMGIWEWKELPSAPSPVTAQLKVVAETEGHMLDSSDLRRWSDLPDV